MTQTTEPQTTAERPKMWAVLEEWRPVAGYDVLYEVSNLGRVRRVGARTGKVRGSARIDRVLKPHTVDGSDDDYLSVQLWSAGKPKMKLVHVLVAIAFIGPVPEGQDVNHIDGIKPNCRADNLEYLTRSKNNEHAYRTGLRAAITPWKLPREVLPDIRAARDAGASLRKLGRQYGVGHHTIARALELSA